MECPIQIVNRNKTTVC